VGTDDTPDRRRAARERSAPGHDGARLPPSRRALVTRPWRPSRAHTLSFGTNISINLEPDTREQTERLFAALAEDGKVGMALQDMFWGGYFGSLTDKFGVQWMVNCTEAKP
jgi:uncharacterized glyoxalase superfamily protein PhnB